MEKILSIYKSKNTNRFMLILIFMFSFTFIYHSDFSKVIISVFILISLPLFIIEFKLFKKDPMFFLFILVMLIQVLSWMNAQYYFPEFSNEYPKLDRLMKLFSFIFIAYWLRGSKKSITLVMLFFLFGYIFSILNSDAFFANLDNALDGKRVDFSIKNAQFTSMLAGVSIMLTSFILLEKIIKRRKRFLISLLIPLLISFLLLLLVSQSRQTWLALIIVSLLLPVVFVLIYPRISRLKLGGGYLILFLCFYGVSSIEIVEKRLIGQTLERETVLINSLFSGKFDEIPSKGNGIRVKSWIEASEWIKEHPLLGNGSNAIGEVMMQSKRFNSKDKKQYKHLHSFHIELLVAYGILGALVIYGMYYWFIRSLVLAHREDPELKMYTVLGICFLIFWIIINFFESFSSRSYGVYVHNIIFGCLYTFYFTQQRKKIEEAEACA